MNIQKLKTTKRPTALETFVTKRSEIDNMLARLVEVNDNHYEMNPDELHWGHVGDITGIAEDLKQITDSVFKEGEYAE